MTRILIADDEKAIRDAVKLALLGEGYELSEASTLEEVYTEVTLRTPDLVLLDVHFKPGRTSHEIMQRLRDEGISVPIIVLSGAATAKEAADLIRLGAFDFIEKPLSTERLKVAITRALESALLKASLARITIQRAVQTELIGSSPQMAQVKRLISQYARRDAKILITGETGTGKEVVAHCLWQNSPRHDKSFIIVNAAAIPENLIESELFGHKRGAFTGAVSDQIGKIELAQGGTLFLDEIGELSPKAQTKLLRFLENGEIQRIGATQSSRVDVRFIAATSRDLEEEMKKGRFREDLYFRINIGRIEMPPLRDRGDDVLDLFQCFVKATCLRYEEAIRDIQTEVPQLLKTHRWPGNVRELRNVAERAVLLTDTVISRETVASIIGHAAAPQASGDAWLPSTEDEVLPLRDFRKNVEKEYIARVLALAGGSIAKAAKLLDVDRSHLHQKATQLGIHS